MRLFVFFLGLFLTLPALPAEGGRLGELSGRFRLSFSGEEKSALLAKAREAHDRHRWDEAISLYRQALDLDPDLVEAWQGLGEALGKCGRWEEAEEVGRRTLSLVTEKGDERGRSAALGQLGAAAENLGSYVEAGVLYQKSLTIERRLGNELAIARRLNNLGIIAWKLVHYDEAKDFYQQSIQIAKRIGDESGVATTLMGLSTLAKDLGRYDDAERLYGESLEIRRRIGDEAQAPCRDARQPRRTSPEPWAQETKPSCMRAKPLRSIAESEVSRRLTPRDSSEISAARVPFARI